MKKIGNIVTKGAKKNYNELFNVVASYDNIDNSIPTLIIGWENAQKYIPEVNILEKQYSLGDIWWTFSKTERRCEYEEDIIAFYEYCVKRALENVKYTYVDILKFKLNSIKKMINFAKNARGKIGFITRNSNFLFVYSEEYNTVFGISLSLCNYLGIEKKKVISLFKHTFYIHDTSFIDNNIKRIIGYNTHYILPLYKYFTK